MKLIAVGLLQRCLNIYLSIFFMAMQIHFDVFIRMDVGYIHIDFAIFITFENV